MPSVYISHAYADSEFARQFARDLEDRGLTVRRGDPRRLRDDRAETSTKDEIERAQTVVFILSEDAVRSAWLLTEAALALSISGKRVISIFSTVTHRAPLILHNILGVDLSDRETYRTSIDDLALLMLEGGSRTPGGPDDETRRRHLRAILDASTLQQERVNFEHAARLKTRALAISAAFVAAASLTVSMLIVFVDTLENTTASIVVLMGAMCGALGGVIGYLLSRSKTANTDRSMSVSKSTAGSLLRLEESLRQQRQTFDQRREHDERWFTLRLRMGYIAAFVLPALAIACCYILFWNEVFPTMVVSAASVTLFVDVAGLVAAVWKIVLSPGAVTRLEPITLIRGRLIGYIRWTSKATHQPARRPDVHRPSSSLRSATDAARVSPVIESPRAARANRCSGTGCSTCIRACE